MKKIYTYLLVAFSFLINSLSIAQNEPSKVLVYKKIDTTELKLEVYNPAQLDSTKSYPVMVFFFGGGWKTGNTEQFQPHARYFASRGLICILVNYRVKERNGTTPIEALKDAKSAIRFLRKNAAELHIDTGKVIAAGGSAGGQLAAATAYTTEFNEVADDLSISSKPNTLVLFNPIIDMSPGGVGYEIVGEQYKSISPIHNIKQKAPPIILLLGTKDNAIPVETAKYYRTAYEKAGNRFELRLYEGQPHGFFNLNKSSKYYVKTTIEVDLFLTSLGYLTGEPTISLKQFQNKK